MLVLDIQLINELIVVLDQEERIYDDILKISKNKTNIIVEGKVSELESIVKIEQSLVLQMAKIEDAREKIVTKLAAQLNLKPSEITISTLLKHLKGDQSTKLKKYQEGISGTINELRNANDLNSKLIKNSLDYINFSINIMTSVDTGVNNYGNKGVTNDPKKRTFFDMKL